MLRARLLGAFEVMSEGRVLAGLNAPRLQSVLAYLMLHRGTLLSRQHIAFTFWSDTPEDKARNNLRQIIHQLRHALADADRHLQADASTIGWLNVPDFQLDVAGFEDAIAKADAAHKAGHRHSELTSLEQAAGAYGGDLLPGCYDDWVIPERERLRQSFADVLGRLAATHEAERNLAAAIAAMQRRLTLDPLHEESYITLMRLHALNDDRAGALRVYQAGVSTFKQELGLEPSEAMQAAHVRLQRGVPSQTQDASPELPPLIGRRREWEQLLAAWQGSAKGQTQFALIAGEAGIGKTRLAEELMAWARRQGMGVAHARTYAAEGRLSFAPVVEWLRSEPMRAALPRLDKVWLGEVGRILPELFIEQPGLPQPAAMTDAAQRTRFFEALARAVLAAPHPLLLVLDDVQWCDQDTLEWLRYLLRFDAKARLMIVATCRTEELDDKHPVMALLRDLRSAGQMHEIELKRLDAAETSKLATHILKRDMALSEATRLFRDTEGNPLFTVEMARAGLKREGEAEPDASVNLPPRIHAVIASRFAQLSEPAMEVLQLGATVGRAFSFDVLLKASDAGEETLLKSLDELWRRRIVGAEDGKRYDFTHDKLREVAYAQIGPAKRRLLHRKAAQAIEAVHAHDLDAVSAQLAAQFELAGMAQSAAAFCLRAAKVARRVFAGDQAIGLLRRGLSLLPKTGDDRSCLELEFEMLTMLSTGFGVTASADASMQFATLERAQLLGQQLGKPVHPSILRALSTNYVIRANLRGSQQVGEQLLQLAEENSDRGLEVEAYEALGITHTWTGEFALSRSYLEKSLALHEAEHLNFHVNHFAWDPHIVGQCRLALTLNFLGYLDQALQAQQASLTLGEAMGHPFSLAYSMGFNGFVQMMFGNADAVREQSLASLALSHKHGNLEWWLRKARIQYAWNEATIHPSDTTLNGMWQCLNEFYTLGSLLMRPYYYTLLAPLHAKLGQFEKSLQLLAEAQEMTERTNERWYEAETHRVRGDVLLMEGVSISEVEIAYRQAIEVAQYQQAKLLELRAATSLARLWQSQGRRAEARNLLQPIYDWFTEGFDTRDLKQAKALLHELTIS